MSAVSDVELGYLSGVTSSIQTQLNSASNIVKFICAVGNVFYTPTTGSNLPSLIMTPEGGTVATFKHDLILFYKNLDAGAYDVKANPLSGNVLTELDTFVKHISYTKSQIDTKTIYAGTS